MLYSNPHFSLLTASFCHTLVYALLFLELTPEEITCAGSVYHGIMEHRFSCTTSITKPIDKIKSMENNNSSPQKSNGDWSQSSGEGFDAWDDPKVTNSANPKLNFRSLVNKKHVENSDCVLPLEQVIAAQNKFANSLVSFFCGKESGLPVSPELCKTGLEQVLGKGPYLIRNQPIILTKWSPNMSLSRDKVTKVPVWVKVHKVPVVAYSEDGLSIIATRKPIMLDAFTNSMCAEPWGRLGFARALIEVTAEKDLKQEVTMAIPIVDGEGHTMAKMDVEYEWKPPRCSECLVFGHANEQCPKQVTEVPKENVTAQSDGFTTVQNRKKKGKRVGNNQARPAEGFKVSKPSQVWNIKSTKKGSGTQKDDSSKLVNQNPFDILNTVDNVKELGETSGDKEAPKETKEKQINLEYESKVEEMVVSENQLNVYAILESHVEINTLANVCSKVFRNWDWTSNAGLCNKGCRIILGWNKDVVDVVVMHQTDQAIHVKVIHQADQKIICCTFIYAGNDPRERRVLWADLKLHNRVVSGLPWVLLGDFNVALNMEDICMGSSSMNSAMCDFKDYVRSIEVMDIHSTGLHFTWN
ncbi:hypothetical protein Tco_0966083 [Tanacetum coccineum]